MLFSAYKWGYLELAEWEYSMDQRIVYGPSACHPTLLLKSAMCFPIR
jgi:hypothetical protein